MMGVKVHELLVSAIVARSQRQALGYCLLAQSEWFKMMDCFAIGMGCLAQCYVPM